MRRSPLHSLACVSTERRRLLLLLLAAPQAHSPPHTSGGGPGRAEPRGTRCVVRSLASCNQNEEKLMTTGRPGEDRERSGRPRVPDKGMHDRSIENKGKQGHSHLHSSPTHRPAAARGELALPCWLLLRLRFLRASCDRLLQQQPPEPHGTRPPWIDPSNRLDSTPSSMPATTRRRASDARRPLVVLMATLAAALLLLASAATAYLLPPLPSSAGGSARPSGGARTAVSSPPSIKSPLWGARRRHDEPMTRRQVRCGQIGSVGLCCMYVCMYVCPCLRVWREGMVRPQSPPTSSSYPSYYHYDGGDYHGFTNRPPLPPPCRPLGPPRGPTRRARSRRGSTSRCV